MQELPIDIHGLGVIFHPHLHDFQLLILQPVLPPLRIASVKRWQTRMAARSVNMRNQLRGNNWQGIHVRPPVHGFLTFPPAAINAALTLSPRPGPCQPKRLLQARSLKSVHPFGSAACSPGAKMGSSTRPPVRRAASCALTLPGLTPCSASRCWSLSPAMITGLLGKRPFSDFATSGRLPESKAATVANPRDLDRLAAVA